MSKYINPFSDEGFKRIFGQEISKPLLLDFLNTLLEGERHIKNITFLDKEQFGESTEHRSLIYDVYCEVDNGEHIIVEMQNKPHPNFKERCIFYTSRSISNQGRKGAEWMYDVSAVYLIAFMNFRDERMPNKFRTDVALMDRDTGELFSDKMRMIFLQLPYFTREVQECENHFECWIYVLKHMDTLQRFPFLAQDAVFKRLSEITDVDSLSKEERAKYEASLREYRDYVGVLEYQRNEGEKKGLAKGLRQTAANLKHMGMSSEQISQATGLSIAEIEEL